MILSRAIAIERKLLFSKIGLIDQFRKAVFLPLCFLPFSWSILIRKLIFGGVSESSGSPLDDGHRDFENRCRNGWENWSLSWHFHTWWNPSSSITHEVGVYRSGKEGKYGWGEWPRQWIFIVKIVSGVCYFPWQNTLNLLSKYISSWSAFQPWR